MSTYVVRLWVPDRPGALGAVASRIGAVRGDVVGIDILERGGGRAIDELVVELPGEELLPLLVNEVSQVDGVDVEDVRPASEALSDPRLDALETAAALTEKRSGQDLLETLVAHVRHDLEAEWAVVLDLGDASGVAATGEPPPARWLQAFVAGSRTSERVVNGDSGPEDVAWAAFPASEMALIVGRRGRPFRSRERRQLSALARIAGCRWSELVDSMASP
jgi:hypothetical protein